MSSRKAELHRALEETRNKTLWLLGFVPDEFLKVRVHSFYSPIGWHFGHVGRTEEYWISHKALGRPVIDDNLSFLFADLPENPKDNRVHLPSREQILEYLAQTRERTFRDLEGADFDPNDPFLADGFAFDFAVQHECQHQETICEMLQLIQKEIASEPKDLVQSQDPSPQEPPEFVDIPRGTFTMGSNERCVYDNEKNEHEVAVAGFKLATHPVTVGQWRHFVDDGGYRNPAHWSAEGWAWRCSEDAMAPEYWASVPGGYASIGSQGLREIHPDEPVSSLSWYEAQAFCHWAKKRMPTEEEWEYVAREGGGRYPWGNDEPDSKIAVFGITSWGPLPVDAKPEGTNLLGVQGMGGNVWEWTSSKFLPYPGFAAFPYDGYSKDHMKGEHYVCRGGSWATAAPILRSTFRNWYVPTYRQGFLGLRCADD